MYEDSTYCLKLQTNIYTNNCIYKPFQNSETFFAKSGNTCDTFLLKYSKLVATPSSIANLRISVPPSLFFKYPRYAFTVRDMLSTGVYLCVAVSGTIFQILKSECAWRTQWRYYIHTPITLESSKSNDNVSSFDDFVSKICKFTMTSDFYGENGTFPVMRMRNGSSAHDDIILAYNSFVFPWLFHHVLKCNISLLHGGHFNCICYTLSLNSMGKLKAALKLYISHQEGVISGSDFIIWGTNSLLHHYALVRSYLHMSVPRDLHHPMLLWVLIG